MWAAETKPTGELQLLLTDSEEQKETTRVSPKHTQQLELEFLDIRGHAWNRVPWK